jgi:hypothetical protein
VNGFHDIHESLEAATAAGEIETVNNDTTLKSGQEVNISVHRGFPATRAFIHFPLWSK